MATETANVFGGSQSLELTVPEQDEELSNATDKVLTEELDLLFLRYYSKFQAPYDVVGSSHNGSMISAHYFIDGNATPGIRANGTNKFLVNYENWRGETATPSPGEWRMGSGEWWRTIRDWPFAIRDFACLMPRLPGTPLSPPGSIAPRSACRAPACVRC